MCPIHSYIKNRRPIILLRLPKTDRIRRSVCLPIFELHTSLYKSLVGVVYAFDARGIDVSRGGVNDVVRRAPLRVAYGNIFVSNPRDLQETCLCGGFDQRTLAHLFKMIKSQNMFEEVNVQPEMIASTLCMCVSVFVSKTDRFIACRSKLNAIAN